MLRIFRIMPLRVAGGLTQTADKDSRAEPLSIPAFKGKDSLENPFVRFASLRMLVKLAFSISSDSASAGLNHYLKPGASFSLICTGF